MTRCCTLSSWHQVSDNFCFCDECFMTRTQQLRSGLPCGWMLFRDCLSGCQYCEEFGKARSQKSKTITLAHSLVLRSSPRIFQQRRDCSAQSGRDGEDDEIDRHFIHPSFSQGCSKNSSTSLSLSSQMQTLRG